MEKITSRRNSHVIHARNLGKDRNYREEHGEFLCDGGKLLEEALKCGADIVSVFTVSEMHMQLPDDIIVFEVPSDILASISPLKNPQDVIFVCKMPVKPDVDLSSGIHILLDNVQDPGNVGTIFRSANAFGIRSVILTHGCADPYNPKAIRASMGAIFRQRHCYIDINQLRSDNVRLIGTAKNKDYQPVRVFDKKDAVIVIGSEGQGISKDILTLCEGMITIPVMPECESLNASAAASIIMYELRVRN